MAVHETNDAAPEPDERRLIAVWCAAVALAAAVIGVWAFTLLGRYRRAEGVGVLDLTADRDKYHLVLETIPAWAGTAVIAASLLAGIVYLRRREVDGRPLAAFVIFHVAVWLALGFALGLLSESAFP